MKPKYIICENKAERDAVLKKLEKNGYIWANGESLTEWTLEDVWEDKSISFHLNKEQTVTWAFTRTEHREHPRAVSAHDYLGKHKPILITRKGRVVTAEDKNSGDKAIATCCPTDTFDFGTGAMIAVARLIAQSDKGITKDAETVLRQLLGYDAETPADVPTEEEPTTKFKIGDLVTLKDGLDVNGMYGEINLLENMYKNGYSKPMRVINTTECDDGDIAYDCIPVGDRTSYSYWYAEEMLESWDENKIHEGDRVHVKKGCTKDRYDTYYKWLKDNISDVDLLLGFERRESVSTDEVYTVVKIAPHGHFTGLQLAFIKRTDGLGNTYSYLFDISALEKVTK